MEVQICIPAGSDIKILESEYSDIYLDSVAENKYGTDIYFVGQSSDASREKGEREWLSYNEAVDCCGFVEGAIKDAETLIEGNGAWAQGMISRKDFSSLAVTDKVKKHYKRESNRYWRAYRRGKAASSKKSL